MKRRMTIVGAAILASVGALLLPAMTAQAAGPVRSIGVMADGGGYVAVDQDGDVHAYGSVTDRGDPRGFTGGIVGVATTADGRGYVAVSGTGQVYAFGAVTYRGNPTGFSGQIVGISTTADGSGYAVVSSRGQVYAYGSVRYRSNPTGFSGDIRGISVTADGQGYAVISSRGQVYAYGTVQYRGNPTGFSGDIRGISVTANGLGYAAVSTAAQVYAYGTVKYRGNPYQQQGEAFGISVTASGSGYAVVTSSGQIHTYGPITFRGDYGDVDNQGGTQHLRAASYADWNYSGSSRIYNVDQTLYVVNKARSTYWAMDWAWSNTSASSGGYMGVQTNGNRNDGSTGDTALFSLWNANGSRGSNCGAFGGEGTGLSCRLPYTIYGDGTSYRLRLWRLESDAQGQWWGAWIKDSRRGDKKIGELRVPNSASTVAHANNFAEYYGSRLTCDTVPESMVNWGQPTYLGEVTDGLATLRETPKASCTGGRTRWATLADGSRVVQMVLGGARPNAL